ncbi:MAG: nucleotidyl transferase AbiEii/AbiGii toxin family protein [Lysobacteraceae bacterium]
MFRRPHHQRIGLVLQALDADKLLEHGCLFGGGTAIALRYGEYRESVDMDFLVSDAQGYRRLRTALRLQPDLSAILRPSPSQSFSVTREVRADQYGIRTMLQVLDTPIKFEMVFEARIGLDAPGPEDRISGVACLTVVDMVASKLLANSDRWADTSVLGRDLIDLAMMQPSAAVLAKGVDKAAQAYGRDPILRDLDSAIDRMAEQPAWLARCLASMAVDAPQALVWQRIRALRRALDN